MRKQGFDQRGPLAVPWLVVAGGVAHDLALSAAG